MFRLIQALGLSLSLLGLASSSLAQTGPQVPVRGQLVDVARGAPIAGVTVRIDGTSLQATTDEQGWFQFLNVPQGSLRIVAADPLVVLPPTELSAEARTTSPVIPAFVADGSGYQTTVVDSRARPQTASTSHITARDFAAVPRRNAEDALRLVPGLTLVQHGSEGKGHQFFLRGFDAIHGSDLELTVEGLPINEWSNIHAQGYVDLGFIIPEVIESVEVTKGPFALTQGAFGMAGSADYRLGVAEHERGLRATYSVGTTNRHRGVVTYTPREADGRDFLAAEALHDDGFGHNRGIDRGAVLGRLRLVDSSANGTLSLLVSAYLARFELPGTVRNEDVRAGRIDFDGAYDARARGKSTRGLIALEHEWLRERLTLHSTVSAGYRRLDLLENYTGFLVDPLNGDRRRQHQGGWSFVATTSGDIRLSERLRLEAGAGTRGDLLDQTQGHVDQREVRLADERRLDGVQTLTHLYAGVRWRPVEDLRLAAGSRLDVAHVSIRDGLDGDRRSDGTLWALSPRFTAQWRAGEDVRLFAAYGRGFRPPEARAFSTFEPSRTGISEDLYEGGDPKLTVADSLELGTRWSPKAFFGAGLSIFATFIERESVFDHVSGINLELNSTRRIGTELELTSSPFDWLTLSADVTYVDARFVRSGNRVPLAPWLTAGFRAVATHASGFHGGLRFAGLASRPLPHGARGAPLSALDATVGYRWKRLTVDLDVENLLAKRLREGEYHYASHWNREAPASVLPVIHSVAGPPLNARLGVTTVF